MRRKSWTLAGALSAILLVGVGWAAAARTKLAPSGAADDNAQAASASRLSLGTPSACAAYQGLPEGFARDAHAGMVRVPAGSFELGSRRGYVDERPAGMVTVESFWIDQTEVTNAQFAAFVSSTGHVTVPEREGGSAVFHAPSANDVPSDEATGMSWWRFERGANWRHPDGPESDLTGKDNLPAVQITATDAAAYAAWLGHELPTEAQWEYAARAGRSDDQSPTVPRDVAGHPTANYWQGSFPTGNTKEDGYEGRAPVGCFAANGFGLDDAIGNVWEWTRDRFQGHSEGHCTSSHEPVAANGARLVIKGGSFLCSPTFCSRYRAAARYPQETNLATNHVGFRTIAVR